MSRQPKSTRPAQTTDAHPTPPSPWQKRLLWAAAGGTVLWVLTLVGLALMG